MNNQIKAAIILGAAIIIAISIGVYFSPYNHAEGRPMRNMIAMLEDLGHTAIVASSGHQALDLLRGEERVDLVITDQIMPKKTGRELATVIKAEWPKLPIVIASGYAEMPRNVPCGPRLAKPFTQAELADKIAAVDQSEKENDLASFQAYGPNI